MKKETLERHKLVIDEWFVNGFNGTQAYKKLYPECTDDSARSNFIRMLANDSVQAYKEECMERAASVSKLSHLEVLEYLKTWMFADITETINLTPQQVKELPIQIRRLITQFKHTKRSFAEGTMIEDVVELKFVSKEKALDLITKHIGFFEEDNKQTMQPIIKVLSLGTGKNPNDE